MSLRRIPLVTLFIVLLFALSGLASAQSTLTPGTAQLGTLSAEAPLALFTFQGTEGDLAQIQVFGLAPGMNLTASLQSPSQQSLGSGASSLSAKLPATGTYSVLVGGSTGDFVVALNVIPTSSATPLDTNAAQELSYTGTEPSMGSFSSLLDSSMAVIISAPADAEYSATLVDGDGTVVGTAHSVPQACFIVAAGDSTYTLLVNGLTAEASGAVSISFAADCGGASPPPAGPGNSQGNQGQGNQGNNQGNQGGGNAATCTVSSGQTVNIRSGAGTNYNVVGQLSVGTTLPVTGTTSNGWYQVQGSFGTGYVSQGVTSATGPCNNLPVVSGQPADNGAGPVTTQEPGAPTDAAPTDAAPTDAAPTDAAPTDAAPTDAPTTAPTETPPPTATQAAQIAPPDSNYSLNVPLDGTASITDFVSYPDGDTEDFTGYGTSGLNPSVALPGGRGNLVFSLSCFGTGTQHIVFRIDGQNFSCGQTFTREVNADSDTGGIRVTATGGTNTYVQWVVQASLTRIN